MCFFCQEIFLEALQQLNRLKMCWVLDHPVTFLKDVLSFFMHTVDSKHSNTDKLMQLTVIQLLYTVLHIPSEGMDQKHDLVYCKVLHTEILHSHWEHLY